MDSARREQLLRTLPCRAQVLVPLSMLTTFRIGGPAQILAEPDTVREMVTLFRIIRSESVPFFYLGHGSNILVSDEGFDGVVVRAGEGLSAIRMDGDIVHAGPGARLLKLTAFAAARSLTGMEPLCGIPGSVGGGLFMNAGAYGGEIADTFVDADVLLPDRTLATVGKKDIGFGYRSAPALQNVIILESRYRLGMGDKSAIYQEMRRVWKLRRAKQPLEYPSAGSIFKRPPGDYAGRLIEVVGGKGARVGDAMVSPKHAGIFVNIGHATARDVAALVRNIRKRIFETFNILLEPEVKPVGFPEDPFAIPTES